MLNMDNGLRSQGAALQRRSKQYSIRLHEDCLMVVRAAFPSAGSARQHIAAILLAFRIARYQETETEPLRMNDVLGVFERRVYSADPESAEILASIGADAEQMVTAIAADINASRAASFSQGDHLK